MDTLPVTVDLDAEGIVPCINQDVPSCQGCRHRKLKCSREQPNCTHCNRLGIPCVYELRKNKPGLKLGAVESLNRRVEALEHTVLELSRNQCNGTHTAPTATPPSNTALQHHARTTPPRQTEQPVASASTSRDSEYAITSDQAEAAVSRARKRRRLDSCGNIAIDVFCPLEKLNSGMSSLPSPRVMEKVITTYFSLIQPWIPILHETRFRAQLHDGKRQRVLVTILHAMVVATLRLVDRTDQNSSPSDLKAAVDTSRNTVLLAAMNDLCVENLQALSIIAFTDIGNGNSRKAWSLVGSLTRTVEYLQLSVEVSHHEREPLLRPLVLLSPPSDWTHEEERRRAFWAVFCLDRFCSVTTGWNTSLTSDDVQRRLPADGGLWHKSEPVVTPYFGIWDRSAAKIGNSIAFMPGHYATPDQSVLENSSITAQTAISPQSIVDMTTVGAFAYRIEATESLSRITTYFLQQNVSFNDRQELSDWLTRFKELDLRLVHWKMFLPHKWRDSNISRQPACINMDPNLTLAHITHNTSMILLHQRIAYPDPSWANFAQLPSSCSADTCQVAATETCTIMEKYLRYTTKTSLVSSQFSFCVFMSARVLLVHWRYYRTCLAPEFHRLVRGLDELALRWAGPGERDAQQQCLAGRYSSRLKRLQAQCEADPNFAVDVLGYSDSSHHFDDIHEPARDGPVHLGGSRDHEQLTHAPHVPTERGSLVRQNIQGSSETCSFVPASETSAPEQLDASALHAANYTQSLRFPPTEQDDLSAISRILMDQQFLDMDRVISFDDMLFTAQTVDDPLMPWAQSHVT